MKTRRIIIEEIFRAFVFGAIVFMTVSSLLYRSGLISVSTGFLIPLVPMVVMFVSFTIVRIRTGQELKVQGALGWSILLAVIYALELIFVSIGVVLGQADLIFAHGIWPIIAGVLLTALFAWLGYKTSEKHPPQN